MDSAARPVSAVDTANNINYATGGGYAAQDAISALTLGSASGFTGINISNSYTKRLQPNELKTWSTAGTAMDSSYGFLDAISHNNGDVIGITNNSDTTRSQQFTYDHLNRLITAETTSTHATSPTHCWGESMSYDQWGNLTTIGVVSTAYDGCTQESLSVSALANNQLSSTGISYDASGNILTDGHNTYGWNAESEIKSAGGVNYTYDGDGNRVQKSNGKIYWYGAGSEVLDESDSAGNITDEYVFFGGKRIAHRVVSGNSVSYYAEDMLGSSRVIMTSTGTVCYDADFYPFGGERIVTNTCAQNYKFEGKERDTETNNDDFGARYYSSSFGRWTSPDWSAIPVPVPYANLTNPQTLNLYAMVSDNPETFADLDGHKLASDPCLTGNCEKQNEEQENEKKAQNLAWSSLSSGQQALVQGGENAWGSLSATQQSNFGAITHALEATQLSNGSTGLSEVSQMTEIGPTGIAVNWKTGAKEAFKDSGFAWRPGWGHAGENGVTKGGGVTGLHVLFGDKDAGVGHAHIDYRGLFEGHYQNYNSDVRAIGPEKRGTTNQQL